MLQGGRGHHRPHAQVPRGRIFLLATPRVAVVIPDTATGDDKGEP